MKIEFTDRPEGLDVQFLTDRLNEEAKDYGSMSSFAFFIRDHDNQIIAGCNGGLVFGIIYTAQLWVHSTRRKEGLGRMLLESVHDYGRKNGCSKSVLSTLTFQNALEFYNNMGYVIDFKRDGYSKGSSLISLSRQL